MKILITGDFVVTDEFQDQDLIDGSVIELFEEADYRIVNLEAPVTSDNSENKILKTGPYLRSSAKTALPYLKQLKVDMVTLANNHVLDYGEQGLKETITFCANNDISTVGAGNNLKEAKEPKRIKIEGKTISIINFAENEWANASEDRGGAHPMDIIDNARLIQSEEKESDYVIVIIHGGHEYYQYPSPRMQKQYRYYVDQGADLIVGHHTHCISGYEVYNESPIFYSLGNFLFTRESSHSTWYKGLVLKVILDDKSNKGFDIDFVFQNTLTHKVGLAKEEQLMHLKNQIHCINNVLNSEEELNEKWERFLKEQYEKYLKQLSPIKGVRNRYLKGILYRLKVHKLFYKENFNKEILNRFRCEAHRDISLESLKQIVNK